MGTKFAHFSILDADLDEAKALLTYLPRRGQISQDGVVAAYRSFFPDDQAGLKEFQENSMLPQLTRLLNLPTVVYVGQNGRWVTIASEEFGFESIQDQALALSNQSERIFLAFAVFDEDVLVLSLVQKGTVRTRHVSGGETYGLASCAGAVDTIAAALGIAGQEAELQKILRNDDTYEKTMNLERLAKMRLWLPIGWASQRRESGIKWQKVTLRRPKPQTAHQR